LLQDRLLTVETFPSPWWRESVWQWHDVSCVNTGNCYANGSLDYRLM